MITQDELKKLIHYDPETGVVTYIKHKPRVARFLNKGYVCVSIKNKQHHAHRLAWLYMYGYLPEHDIDHINRKRDDNRLSNLREVSRSCNLRNRGNSKNNRSGVKGVAKHNKRPLFEAYIKINKVLIRLGYFEDFEEAVCHRLAAEQAEGWEGCDSSSPAYQYVCKNIQGGKV